MLVRVGPLGARLQALDRLGLLPVDRGLGERVRKPRPPLARLVAWPKGFSPLMVALPERLRPVPMPRRRPGFRAAVQLVAVPDPDRDGPPPDPTLEPTLTRQIRATCHRMRLTREELAGPCRRRELMLARAELMWLGAVHYGLSLPTIGRMMGGRDHTTALHARRKVDAALRAAGLPGTPAMLALEPEVRRLLIADFWGRGMGG
ncbi:helix-turn-helix domain-containing protein [Phreatobacter sp.]|uniref:helix-turn-helix domain-containing protein n=1 Tax=Phreatobacter sp. TaxID=1966341 RepID=UPI003F7236A8